MRIGSGRAAEMTLPIVRHLMHERRKHGFGGRYCEIARVQSDFINQIAGGREEASGVMIAVQPAR